MYRRLVATSAAYLGDLIPAETTAALDTPVTLPFGRFRCADSQGIGRVVKLLADSGKSLAEALEMGSSGLANR